MAERLLMPKQGNTVESCVILEWKKKEGDHVDVGDVLCEVETDKASFEIVSEHQGIVLKILHREGEDVPVLKTIAFIGELGEELPADAIAEEQYSRSRDRQPSKNIRTQDKPRDSESVAFQARRAPNPAIRISPRARNFAAAHGVDVTGLTGSGPGGRILEADVQKALEEVPVGATGYPGPSDSVSVEGFRAVIARRMRTSLSDTAQLSMYASADAGDILAYRKKLKAVTGSPSLAEISIGDMVMFSVVRALKRFPDMNAHFLGDRIEKYNHIHLGVAVDTSKGLLVPTIRWADDLSLSGLSLEKRRLVEICRAGKAGPEELAEATFTVTNLGTFGIENFTPVLNTPQVGILGICSTRLEPMEVSGEMCFVPKIGLSLTIDHQAVDGAPAARFLHEVCDIIAHFQVYPAE